MPKKNSEIVNLVTGGAGFIGSHLVEALLARGEQVRVLDNFSTGHRRNLRGLEAAELIEGDIREPETCRRACAGVDYVFHEAALPSVPRSIADPETTHAVCATGTLNVLQAARAAAVRRVIYAGSSSAYGNTEVLPKVETMAPAPRSPYAVAKLAGEHYCAAYFHAYGLETVTLRYFNIFGPRQDPNSQYSGVIARFCTQLLAGDTCTIHGDGETTRDFTYIANAVQANLLARDAAPAPGRMYNVACGERTSLMELHAALAEAAGCTAKPRLAPERAGDIKHSLADITAAKRDLGYTPAVDLRSGLRRTFASYSRKLVQTA
ncbi:MAG TPA: SDR family oxidoreductase [Terriglobales bacterium]|nr:SDR family oxidoreductase [Terriglobales bacterium]